MQYDVETRLIASSKRPKVVYIFNLGDTVEINYDNKVIVGILVTIRQDGITLYINKRKKFFEYKKLKYIRRYLYEQDSN